MGIQLPSWTEYTVNVGAGYATYLEESGPRIRTLCIMDLGDGRVALDTHAVEALQRQPEDADGHIDSEMQMWLEGDPYPVNPAGA